MEEGIYLTSIVDKIEKLYKKIYKQKAKLVNETQETKKLKYQRKCNELLEKLVSQKKKVYKKEIQTAKKLKHDGILIPLSQHDHGCIYTDDIHDIQVLIDLARLQSWSKKCFWIDFKNKETKVIELHFPNA